MLSDSVKRFEEYPPLVGYFGHYQHHAVQAVSESKKLFLANIQISGSSLGGRPPTDQCQEENWNVLELPICGSLHYMPRGSNHLSIKEFGPNNHSTSGL